MRRPPKDIFYDYEAEERDKKLEENNRKIKAAQTYIKRVITHPSFKNISFKEALDLMEHMDQGECIIRPSSKVSKIVLNFAPLVYKFQKNFILSTLVFEF